MQQVFAALDQYRAIAPGTRASKLCTGAKTGYFKVQQVFAATEVRRDMRASFELAHNLNGFTDAVSTSDEVPISSVEVARCNAETIAASRRRRVINE